MKKVLTLTVALLLVCAAVIAQAAPEAAKSTGPDKVTIWTPLNAQIAQVADSYADTIFWQEIIKATNTEIDFQHVSDSNEAVKKEAFNILIASGDYPDVIYYQWTSYPGGAIAAIDDGVIIPLNDIIDKYCPNLKKLLEDYPDVKKMITTDDGTIYVFPFLRGVTYENNNLLFSEGWVWRMDLLNAVGITECPSTPDELYSALVKLADYGVQIPLCIRGDHISRVLAPGFDSFDDFYVEDGVVKHGYYDPERKDYLAFTAKLYQEKLLDNDYLSVDKKSLGVKVLNGLCAGAYAPGGSGIGSWLPAMQAENPSVSLVSARPISPEAGRLSKFSKMNNLYDSSGSSAAITTACKNIEAVARILDYCYGEEGHLLANFGIEGVSYNMVDGYPKYTDKVIPVGEATSEGLTLAQGLAKYTVAGASGAFVQDTRYIEQYYSMPELSEAVNLWAQTDYGKYIYPAASTTSEEAEELALIMNQVQTFAKEMEAKFITGEKSLDEYDAYVAQLKKFGIERAIEIKQAAYDRYMAKN